MPLSLTARDWQSGNTSVSFNEENNTKVARLHGNKIAVLGEDFLEILMAVGKQLLTKVVSMPLSMSSAMVSPMVSISATFSGMLKTTTSRKNSRMVTSSLDTSETIKVILGAVKYFP